MLLKNNGFPDGLIEKQLNRILIKFNSRSPEKGKIENQLDNSDFTYLLLPYENKITEEFGVNIKKILETFWGKNYVRLAFIPKIKLGALI